MVTFNSAGNAASDGGEGNAASDGGESNASKAIELVNAGRFQALSDRAAQVIEGGIELACVTCSFPHRACILCGTVAQGMHCCSERSY